MSVVVNERFVLFQWNAVRHSTNILGPLVIDHRQDVVKDDDSISNTYLISET